MKQPVGSYLKNPFVNPVPAIVKGIDKDVEKGEDVLMAGLSSVMISTFFAPIAPPHVLLPVVAAIFLVSATVAHLNYTRMQQKLFESVQTLNSFDNALLRPIVTVFKNHPPMPLEDTFNPIKNWKRTLKSCLGGLLINPFWMPIFYVMGVQINEEKHLAVLNKAIMGVEQRIFPPKSVEES